MSLSARANPGRFCCVITSQKNTVLECTVFKLSTGLYYVVESNEPITKLTAAYARIATTIPMIA